MLARRCSRRWCLYRAVMVASLWPKTAWTAVSVAPFWIRKLAAEWRRRLDRQLPPDWDGALPSFEDGAKIATRAASGTVLNAVAGELPEGYTLTEVTIEPQRVWLTGARSKVIRVTEVLTETIDVSGLRESEERDVGFAVGAEHVWVEDPDVAAKIRIEIEPPPPAEGEDEGGATGEEGTG